MDDAISATPIISRN